MSTKYRIHRIPVDIIVPDQSDEGTTTTLAAKDANGLLRGIIITIPSFTANQPVSKTENIAVAENIGILKT